jgi:hypothetical protein
MGFRTHPASYVMGSWFLSRVQSGRVVKVTTGFYPFPTLGTRVYVPILLHAFLAWKGTTLLSAPVQFQLESSLVEQTFVMVSGYITVHSAKVARN